MSLSPASQVPGDVGAARVGVESIIPHYSFGVIAVAPYATPTDLVNLVGIAGYIGVLKQLGVFGISTTAGDMDVALIKRTALNTGGTSAAQIPAKHDSSDQAAQCPLNLYSVVPGALGAGIVIRASTLSFQLAASLQQEPVVWDFPVARKAPRVKLATEVLALNFNGGAVPAGGKIGWWIEWAEYTNPPPVG